MKLDFSENSIRVDKISFTTKEYVNLNSSGYVYDDLKKIRDARIEKNKVYISRGELECMIRPVGSKIMLEHFFSKNGVRSLRENEIESKYKGLLSADGGTAFVPVQLLSNYNCEEFFYKDFPLICEEEIETVYYGMTSNIGAAIQRDTSNNVVINRTPNKRSLSLKYFEGGVDIVIPKSYKIFDDYNLWENLAVLGTIWNKEDGDPMYGLIWHTNKTWGELDEDSEKDCLQIRGTLFVNGVEFSIYIKDFNHPDFNQVRAELRFDIEALKRAIRTISFSTRNHNKEGLFRLGYKFGQLLNGNVLPFGKVLFDLDYPKISQDDRNLIVTNLVHKIKTTSGYYIKEDQVRKICKEIFSNKLILCISNYPRRLADSIRNSKLFVKVPGTKNLYYLDRKKVKEEYENSNR